MLASRFGLFVFAAALASCGGKVVVDGAPGDSDGDGGGDGLGGSNVVNPASGTSSLGTGAAGAGAPTSPSGPSGTTTSIGGGTPATTAVSTGTTGGGGSANPSLAACVAEAGLPPDTPCVRCAYPLTFESCFPEHLCPGDSFALYTAVTECVCGGPSQPGVCTGPCGAACSGTGEQTQGCSNCTVQGCITELNDCANDN